MARTLIGELILRLKDEMSGKAKSTAGNVTKSLDDIERAAKRLSNAQWGVGFQRQLDKLKTSGKQMDTVRQSWVRLQDDMQKRNLSKAMRGNELAGWKAAIIGNLAAVQMRSKATHAELSRLRNLGGNLLKPAMVAAGGYTMAYTVGIGARAAINSASMEQRERARQHFAGLPKTEQSQIEKQSQELSVKYRISQASAMEIMREARLAMPSAEKAFGVAKEMVQAYKMMGLSFGTEQAITGLRAFNKAMDNINVTEDSNLYVDYLNSFVKAQQITGKDMDPEAFAQAIKYSRTSGKVFSPDFMQNILPFLIAESGGSDTGTQLRAVFDQLVGGQATKKATKEQGRLGLRNKNGVVDAEGFAKNPLDWVYKRVLPALEKDGVDMNSDVQIAQAVSKFASNRLARDFIQRALTQRGVYMRLSEMMQGAVGLSGAGDVDALDPYSAFKGFKDSMANLSAAVIPIEGVSAGLISLANGINAISDAIRNGDPSTQYAVGGIAAAGAGGLAFIIGKSVYGLMTAGTNLNIAAVALQRAAAVQAGGGLGGGNKGMFAAAAAWIATKAPLLSGLLLSGDSRGAGDWASVPGAGMTNQFFANRHNERKATEGFYRGSGPVNGRGSGRGGNLRGEMAPNYASLDEYLGVAKKTGSEVQAALSPTATPQVDVSAINNALALARQLASVLGGIPAMAAQAAASAESAIRQAHTDFGGEAAP